MQSKKLEAPRASNRVSCHSWSHQFAIEKPKKAVGTAFGLGLVLSLLPVGKMAGMLIDTVFSLARPALLAAGVLKISEYCLLECPSDGPNNPKQPTQP